ncbi:hypothetical protein CIPAW_10G131500 [Carya illinoinensis]|uniref:Uncharacterized protein n=1 Tax=Carya illinoinensis TaxID=32201 RepID=A0A8T1PDY1_CARIL|nr:hypothetical protein CIPAW_10G131500 [Carya illinoinensis]
MDKRWIVTGFYGQPVAAKRKEGWNLLRLIHSHTHCPWLCMEDFNKILLQDEQLGSHARSFRQMEDFRTVLEECALMDAGFIGSKYTWCNKREGADFTKARLDRALVNKEWLDLHKLNSVHVLPIQCSNHNRILVSCSNLGS